MGTFELEANVANDCEKKDDNRKIKEECIVALKVYDQCRQQDCLTPSILGPARAAECKRLGNITIQEGEIITPPTDAASVTIDRLRLKKVIIVGKDPNSFRPGFWDIDLKYVFVYTLIFRDAGGNVIGSIKANSIFNKKVTMFGSVGADIVIATDLLDNEHGTLDADPFVLVEAKAVELAAELKYPRCGCCCEDERGERTSPASAEAAELAATEVLVTIGLFTIIKVIRIVNLTVQSKGFCIPKECEEISPLNPCDFFDDIEFPMNFFAPPQKEDFNENTVSPIRLRRRNCDK